MYETSGSHGDDYDAVMWDLTLCIMAQVDRGTSCLHLQSKVVTSVNFYKTTRSHASDGVYIN
jgi:hypothetical protein